MRLSLYSPSRIWRIFRFLLSVYLLIKKRSRFLGMSALSPEALVESVMRLGPSFIKLSQVLATRSDFFPASYLAQLKNLHDEIPPMPPEAFERMFERAFAHNPFRRFEQQCIASASIGQVHAAWLEDGTKVAVKLRREGIRRRIEADIRILREFNRWFRPLFSHYTKHSVEAVINEFSTMILKEVSLDQERANLEAFRAQYHDQPVRFPLPYHELSNDDALVMSFEEGFRFDDQTAFEAAGIRIEPLIKTLVTFYTEQMLVKGLFHADPHPGNLLVSRDAQLVLLDFGMVKQISGTTRVSIIELIKCANERDYEGYVRAAKRLGVVTYDAPEAELAEFTGRMFDIFGNDALDSSSMQQLAFDVLERTRNLPFKLPQEAIYILRVSAIIEGLGTTYVENFNGIKDILPILQDNIPRALGFKGTVWESAVDEFKALPEDLNAFRSMIRRAADGSLGVTLSDAQLEALTHAAEQRLSGLLRGVVLITAAFFILLIAPDMQLLAMGLFAAGAVCLLH